MKPETVIKVENLSKQYRLGNVGLGSLGADVNRWWHTRVLGNEDPYLKIGEENNREVIGNSEYVWALRDINFEVQQGEVLGIIGRNGAGKSTLLKILSRTTGPTTGSIKIKGRVASLLEVGTGFHPELTGRENIFLNGAILGMTKQEIRRKLDEIIAFAGVERYVDTPVKRYSSGMYVRLAFAVAAHLEPEILIVDEVLAVGDAEFQKKAIGKMKDVSQGEGRTVLFVSHNMAAVQNLCNKAMYLRNGLIAYQDKTFETIQYYLSDVKRNTEKELREIEERTGTGKVKFVNIKGFNKQGDDQNVFQCGDEVVFKIRLSGINSEKVKGRVDIGINNFQDIRVTWLSTYMFGDYLDLSNGEICFQIAKFSLAPGSYNINIYSEIDGEVSDWLQNVFAFEIIESDYYSSGRKVPKGQGNLFLDYEVFSK